MGMGKTISILALMKANPMCTLVVAPTTGVLAQWQNSIRDILEIKPYIFEPRHLKISSPDYIKCSLDDFRPHNDNVIVVLVSHECFKNAKLNDPKNRETNLLLKTHWGRVVIDEAHVLKNHSSQMFRGAVQLSADVKWAVTGTPISTKKIPPLMPGGPSHITNDIRSLVTFLLGDAEKYYDVAKTISEDETARLSLMLRNNINREGQNLETRPVQPTLQMEVLEFSHAEAARYAQLYQGGRDVVDGKEEDKGVRILRVLIALRQLCVCESKIQALVRAFQGHRAGTRSLVFCNWTKDIEVVQQRLQGLADRVMVYSGKTKAYEKEDIVAEFQSESRDSMVMILQVRAGSVGLNLQKASRVYIMSPDWSAAMETQAISRACRIDTQHPVTVTRFVMAHSIEEFMCKRQHSKLVTASIILQDDRLKTALTEYEYNEEGVRIPKELPWDDVVALFSSNHFDSYRGDSHQYDDDMFGSDETL
jgi:SNF2 family DNA or RNA helicase